MSLALLVVGTTIIATIAWYFLNRSEENNREEYARRNVKYLPQRNAFLQMVFKERLEEAKHEFFKQGHRIFGYNFLNAYTISAAEPELAQVVLSKEFTNFTNRRAFETNDPFFQNAISIVKDETWKRLRAVMTPTFSTGKLRRMKPLVDDTIRTLNKNMANAIKSSSDVNMKQIYGAFTMDTIIQVAFGTKVDSLVEPNNPVITYAKKLFSVDISFKNIIKFTMILMTPKLANFLKIRINPEVTDFFYKFSMDIINQKRKNMKNGNIGKANNFIELLLEAEVENEEEAAKLKLTEESNVDEFGFKKSTKYITNDELVAQCSLFFLAGYDTTATTLTMASYLLATNPDKQEKLYKEALSVLGKLSEEAGPDGSKDPVDLITLESLSRFEYLAAVVNETLRLYSPATFVEREVSKDMTIQKEDGSCKIHLKKNDIIQFPVYSMHRDPEQFSDPESFKPERFLGEPNFHKYAYIPFGSGPRNCIARSLALLEAKMALLHTIRQYKLSVGSKTKIPPDFYFQKENNREEYVKRNVRYIPQRNAFLQMIFKERFEEAKYELFKQGHRIFGFNFLNTYTVSIAEPELAQVVLSKEFTNFINRRSFETNDPLFQNNVSIVKDEKWKRLRAVMTPTFSTGKLRRMKPLVDDTICTLNRNMANAIKSSSDVNMKRMYGAFTMDTIIQVAFGTKVDSLVEPNNPVIIHARKLFSVDMSFKNIVKFTLMLLTPKFANFLKLRISPEVTDFFFKFAMEIIDQKRKNMKNGNVGKTNNFMELLLEAEVENEEEATKLKLTEESNIDEDGLKKSTKYITNDELVAQCAGFFLAGYDTTATTLTMASYLLATNPDKQDKLYNEISAVINKLTEEAGPDGPKDSVELITFDSLPRFEYLTAVINEALRLYAPATFIEREASRDMTIQKEDGTCKINLKKKDVIQFPVYSMHRDPEQFPEPESFKPERFLGEPTFHKYAYIPFGSGPRSCIARSLALLEAKMALLHTIRQYKLSVSSKTKIPPEFYFQTQLVVPRDVILKVERR